jgi:hypothetical protein
MKSRPSERPARLAPANSEGAAETQSLENYGLFIRMRDMVRKTSIAQNQPRPKLTLRNSETGEVVWESK